MLKLKRPIDSYLDETDQSFEEMIQITIKIHKNYVVRKMNCFNSVLLEKRSVLNMLIAFVKTVQKCISLDSGGEFSSYLRFWRNIKNPTQEAYTILISGIGDDIKNVFDELKKCSIDQTEGINLGAVLPYYLYTCIKKTKDHNLEEFDGDNFDDLDEDEFDENYSFTDVFSFQNTLKKLNIFDKNQLKILEQENFLNSTFNLSNDLNNINELYLPVSDYKIMNTSLFLFWESFGRLPFPWNGSNSFENKAVVIMREIEEEQSLFSIETPTLDLLYCERKKYRTDFKTLDEIKKKEDELEEHERLEDEERLRDDKECESDGDINIEDGGTITTTSQNKKKGRKRRKKKRKKKRNNNGKNYFDKDSLKDRSFELKNLSERIYRLPIQNLGEHQEFKNPVNLLRKIIKNMRKMEIEFDQDGDLEMAKTKIQDEINKVFNDFWVCNSIKDKMAPALLSIYKHFRSKRKKFKLLLVDSECGLLGNILENLIKTARTLYGLKNTGFQFIMQIFSRDTAFNVFDELGLNVFICGAPSTGKTYGMKKVVKGSLNYNLNTIIESNRANTGLQNKDNYAVDCHLDAGPFWTEDPKKLSIVQLSKLKEKLSEISESKMCYNVFIKNDKTGDLESRTSYRIQNDNWGPTQIISNKPLKLPEAIDRFYNIIVGCNRSNSIIRLSRIAGELFKNIKVHTVLQDQMFEFLKEIQADLGFYFLYDQVGGSKIEFNLITAMLVADFCLEKLNEICPFFEDNSRRFVMLMLLAITFGAYRTKALLCNLEGGIYYNKDFICNTAEFCEDFSKRMIIGYEEIIPALFFMIPQYIDKHMIDIIRVIKTKILKIEGKLETRKEIREYFQSVILDKNNNVDDFFVDFKRVSSSELHKRRQIDTISFNDDNSQMGGSSTPLDFGIKQEYIDPNVITFGTELGKELLADEIQKHLKHDGIAVENIMEKLEKLKRMSILIEKRFTPVKTRDDDYPDDTPIYSGSDAAIIHLMKELKYDKDYNELPDNKKISRKILFFKYDKKKPKSSIYRFPIQLFNNFTDDYSGYEILKKIIVEDLPFKNQGMSKFHNLEDKNYNKIVVKAIKVPNLETENLVIEPNEDSPEVFKIINPKFMTTSDRAYYNLLLEFHKEVLPEINQDGKTLHDDLIANKYLIFETSLKHPGYVEHIKSFDLDEEEFIKIINEEHELLKIGRESMLEHEKMKELLDMFNNGDDTEEEEEGESEDYYDSDFSSSSSEDEDEDERRIQNDVMEIDTEDGPGINTSDGQGINTFNSERIQEPQEFNVSH